MTDTQTPTESCANCRHASTHKRARVIEATGFGDQMMFDDADKDETVYTCRARARSEIDDNPTATVFVEGVRDIGSPHAGKEIGPVAINCIAHTPPRPKNERLAELDKRIADFDARMKAKDGNE